MPSRDLNDCEPELQRRFADVKRLFEANLPKWQLFVECTLRSGAEQLEAFLSGHSKIDPRDSDQHKRAMHLADATGKSRAIDVEIVSRSSGRSADKLLGLKLLSGDSYDLLYLVLMLIVERCGLRSGNDWGRDGVAVGPDPKESFVDAGHIELVGGSGE